MRALLLACLLCPAPLAAQAAGAGPAPVTTYITRFDPPPSYRAWYHDTERCLGKRGDFDAIEWFVVPHPWAVTATGKTYAEWRLRSSHGYSVMDRLRNLIQYGVTVRPMITVNAEDWRDSTVVMHESIHDILWRNGWRPADTTLAAKHPTPPFDKCAPAFYTPPR